MFMKVINGKLGPIVVSPYYAALHEVVSVADQIQKQSETQLLGVIKYLQNARNNIKREQSIAKVKWKKVKQAKKLYKLKPRDCWLELKWDMGFEIIGWDEKIPFNKSYVGIDMDPYRLEITPDPSARPVFYLKNDENMYTVEKIIKENMKIKVGEEQYPIGVPQQKELGDTFKSVSGKRVKILDRKTNTFGMKLHLSPHIEVRDFPKMILGGTVHVYPLNEEYPEDGVFFTESQEKVELEKSGGLFRAISGKIDGSVLTGTNNVSYEVSTRKGGKNQKGFEIVLTDVTYDDESYSESVFDPRYLFYEQGINEVWLKKFVPISNKVDKITILYRDEDSFHLWLEKLPEPDEYPYLYIPINTVNIDNQKKAATVLKNYPLKHHRNLLRLFENPERSAAHWPKLERTTKLNEDDWCFLKDITRDGTDAQRRFVEIALDTPDYAFLEGPPGSGKTTAIAELAYQLAKREKKILMVSNTHYAIDNVLEMIVDNEDSQEYIAPIRIGSDIDRVDYKLQKYHLGKIGEKIHKRTGLDEERSKQLAIYSGNLVCGTSTGLSAHPDMKLDYENPAECLFDYLIIDETSKSTFQEFIYPAIFAKKWILVGDVRQLPPYTEEKQLVGNVRTVIDQEHQRALLILFKLGTYRGWKELYEHEQWLIVEDRRVVGILERELLQRLEINDPPSKTIKYIPKLIVIVSDRASYDKKIDLDGQNYRIINITPEDLSKDGEKSVLLSCATWVIASKDIYEKIAGFLPHHLLPLYQHEDLTSKFRHDFVSSEKLKRHLQNFRWRKGEKINTCAELEEYMQDFLKQHTWAKEWVWRIKRIKELTLMDDRRNVDKYTTETDILSPYAAGKRKERLEDFEAITFPSILESLQKGIPINRATIRDSFLSEGLNSVDPKIWDDRHVMLEYQHRMEDEIADIPRKQFYKGQALKTANTIKGRSEKYGFSFPNDSKLPIYGWIDVQGHENKGKNEKEADAIIGYLKKLYSWAEDHPPKVKGKKHWVIATLTFYTAQENLIKNKLNLWTEQPKGNRYTKGNLQIIVGTIDRFQGREADVVLLSLRNTHNIGFMDCMNRMNVGLTRSRFQQIIFGNHEYYSGNKHTIQEWKEIARKLEKIERGG